MFYNNFGKTVTEELEEIMKASCPPEEKPTEATPSVWETKLAGFPLLLWVLLGGALLYFIGKKPEEVKPHV